MDPLSETLREITAVLDRLGIRYAVGGSLASSARSVWRSTNDVDLLANISPAHVDAFVEALGKDWYADAAEIRKSLAAGRSFNIIQMRRAQKVDFFPVREPFHSEQLDRATPMLLAEGKVMCLVATAEDILLAKLRGFEDGGRVSERQWNDITQLIVTNPALDQTYLDRWASRLGVAGLLEKARAEAAD